MVQVVTLTHSAEICDTLYLIIQKDRFVCGAVTQHIGMSSLYIEALDTTGYFLPRKDQKDAVSSLLDYITSQSFGIFSVFSHPKKETIFGKSSQNNLKGYLGPKKLQDFWVRHFSKNHVFVFSNFCDRRSMPFKKMQEVNFFHDDPKQKLCAKDVDINTFFEMLLHRRDFQKGSLVYMVKEDITSEREEDVERKPKNLQEPGVASFKKANKTLERKKCGKKLNKVREALHFLRTSDFSVAERALDATKKFLEEFKCKPKTFKIEAVQRVPEKDKPPVFIKPRKRIA